MAAPNPCAEGDAGRPTSIRHVGDGVAAAKTTAYCYDKAGRMTSATTSPGGPAYTYAFDANTNRTAGPEGAHTLNVVDQLTDTGFDYNLDGSLIAGGGLALGLHRHRPDRVDHQGRRHHGLRLRRRGPGGADHGRAHHRPPRNGGHGERDHRRGHHLLRP